MISIPRWSAGEGASISIMALELTAKTPAFWPQLTAGVRRPQWEVDREPGGDFSHGR